MVIMEKNNYSIPYIDLYNNLYSMKKGKYHYNYKSVDFMFNYKENATKTLIVFHARVGGAEKLPMFYKHSYENDGCNVLTISDKLLESMRSMHNAMYFGTLEIEFDKIYIEIIDACLKLSNTQKNIFFGTCSGAFPAVHYGAIFNQIIVIANGYPYIDDITSSTYEKKVKELAGLSKKFVDNKQHILEHIPQHIFLYINKNDTFVFNLNKDFIMHCKKYIPDNITVYIHNNKIEGRDAHDVFYPQNETFESIIEKI